MPPDSLWNSFTNNRCDTAAVQLQSLLLQPAYWLPYLNAFFSLPNRLPTAVFQHLNSHHLCLNNFTGIGTAFRALPSKFYLLAVFSDPLGFMCLLCQSLLLSADFKCSIYQIWLPLLLETLKTAFIPIYTCVYSANGAFLRILLGPFPFYKNGGSSLAMLPTDQLIPTQPQS